MNSPSGEKSRKIPGRRLLSLTLFIYIKGQPGFAIRERRLLLKGQ